MAIKGIFVNEHKCGWYYSGSKFINWIYIKQHILLKDVICRRISSNMCACWYGFDIWMGEWEAIYMFIYIKLCDSDVRSTLYKWHNIISFCDILFIYLYIMMSQWLPHVSSTIPSFGCSFKWIHTSEQYLIRLNMNYETR